MPSKKSIKLVRDDVLQLGGNNKEINCPFFEFVVRKAFGVFKLPVEVKPKHLNDVFELDLDCRASSPSIPWQPRYKTKGEVFDDPTARNSIKMFWWKMKKGEKIEPPPCKVEADKSRTRAVYIFPSTITAMEAAFAIPLINAYKESKTPIAIADICDMETGGAMKIQNEIKAFSHYACFDFKSFDKNVSKQLIEIAFYILESNLDLRSYENWGIPDASKLLKVIEYIKRYFLETPMCLSNDEKYVKNAGIPSGSYFAPLIGSIVNWIIINYAILKDNGSLPKYCKVFDNHSIVAGDKPFRIYHLSEIVSDIGMMISPNNSILTENSQIRENLQNESS